MGTIVVILDALIVGAVVFVLCRILFGDTPIARLLRLLITGLGGIAYFFLVANATYGEWSCEISMGLWLFLFFGPLALMALILILGYMFGGSENDKKE